MALPKGSASKKIRDAINASTADLADGVTAAQISDATAAGRTVLTAASAAAQRTALGVNTAFPGLVSAPGTATSTGTAGQIAYDATHIYLCVNSNVWVRATLATF